MSSGSIIAAVAQAGSSSRPSIVIGAFVRTASSCFIDAAGDSDWASSARGQREHRERGQQPRSRCDAGAVAMRSPEHDGTAAEQRVLLCITRPETERDCATETAPLTQPC